MTRAVFFNEAGEPQGVSNFVYAEDAEASGGVVSLDEDTPDEEVMATWHFSQGKIKTRAPRPSSQHHWDGSSESWVEDLEALAAEQLRKVDESSESKRTEFVTPGFGQAMTYEAKYREAKRHPQGTRFPFLQAEAAATGSTVSEVAASVLEARTKWEEIGSEIEGSRLKAKKAIRSATTSAAMYSAVQDLKAELASL